MLYRLASNIEVNLDDLVVNIKFPNADALQAYLAHASRPMSKAVSLEEEPVHASLGQKEHSTVMAAVDDDGTGAFSKATARKPMARIGSSWVLEQGSNVLRKHKQPELTIIEDSRCEIDQVYSSTCDNLFKQFTPYQRDQFICAIKVNLDIRNGIYAGKYSSTNDGCLMAYMPTMFSNSSSSLGWYDYKIGLKEVFGTSLANLKETCEQSERIGIISEDGWLHLFTVHSHGPDNVHALFSLAMIQGSEIRWGWSSNVEASQTSKLPIALRNQYAVVCHMGQRLHVMCQDGSSFVYDWRRDYRGEDWTSVPAGQEAKLICNWVEIGGEKKRLGWRMQEMTLNDPKVVFLKDHQLATNEEVHLVDERLVDFYLKNKNILALVGE